MASRLSLILRVRSLQCLFEETLLERGEVEIVRSGVERALLVEDAKRTEGMEVGVGIQETAERLRRDDHGRDRLFDTSVTMRCSQNRLRQIRMLASDRRWIFHRGAEDPPSFEQERGVSSMERDMVRARQ
jgi:hypothetical protein